MNTRGLLGVRINKKDKLAFNSCDSYPTGLGVDMVRDFKLILKRWGLKKIKKLAHDLKIVNEGKKPTQEQKDILIGYAYTGKNGGTLDDWAYLLAETQGSLQEILRCGYIIGACDFIKTSLFCEWVYIVNLDEETLEVYEGFQKTRHTAGRYASKTPEDGYYPCALIRVFKLDKIPTNWAKKLENERC